MATIRSTARKFLSTPSARRATRYEETERRRKEISIHALREEGDRDYNRSSEPQGNFYPRPPRGGRLLAILVVLPHVTISIHALREEGDLYFRVPQGDD